MSELSAYDNDPNIYLFTSLTAGSSHIVTATSRIETILRANKIPFKGVDTATDELAKKLFQRRASGKKLPLIVKQGYVLGGIEEIEEWNEYDEIREALGVTSSFTALPAKPSVTPAAVQSSSSVVTKKENVAPPSSEQNLAIRQLGAEAAKIAASKKAVPAKITTTNPLLSEKTNTPTSATPKKGPAKAEPSGILSPRSIPLPQTPIAGSSATPKSASKAVTGQPKIPKISDLQKPVHAPPSMHAEAASISTPQKTTESSESSSEAETDSEDESESEESEQEEAAEGAKGAEASKAATKKVDEVATAEDESSEGEEDSLEEEDDDEEDENDNEEEEEPEKATEPPTTATTVPVVDAESSGDDEESSDEDSHDAESSTESVGEKESAEATPKSQEQDTKTTKAVPKPQEAKNTSKTVSKNSKPLAKTTKPASKTSKPAPKPSLFSSRSSKVVSKSSKDASKSSSSKAAVKTSKPKSSSSSKVTSKSTKAVPKTQKQDAKDGSKAGESVKD